MKIKILTLITLLCCSLQIQSATCPDPATSSLQWGKIPQPWIADPFSDHDPQGDKTTRFVRANILIAGVGRGIVCNYQNSLGYYSIWWPVSVKIPARTDNNWIEVNMGYACSVSVDACVFYPAKY